MKQNVSRYQLCFGTSLTTNVSVYSMWAGSLCRTRFQSGPWRFLRWLHSLPQTHSRNKVYHSSHWLCNFLLLPWAFIFKLLFLVKVCRYQWWLQLQSPGVGRRRRRLWWVDLLYPCLLFCILQYNKTAVPICSPLYTAHSNDDLKPD